MTRERAIEELKDIKSEYSNRELGELRLMRSEVQALEMAIQALSQEPKEITIEDVKGYCKPRLLTIITNELFYELTHPKIKALSQEPCDDAISRDAVNTLVDELARAISDERCHIPQRGRDAGHIMHDILELPSVTQSGKWIPVSERLPEDGTWNLFTDGRKVSVERYKADALDHFYPNGRWFSLDETIAWMPLPQPYEPQERSEKE